MEVLNNLLDEATSAWRFRWIAIAIAWVVAVIGWLVVLTMPNEYEARARVYVDATTALTPLLQGLAVPQDVSAQASLVRQVMLGRPALEKVALATDPDFASKSPEQVERILDDLQKRIVVRNVIDESGSRGSAQQDSLYLISFRSGKRQTALDAVQLLLKTFVEDTLGGNRTGSESAQQFLKGQVDDYAARLGEAERALADFKKANLGLVPGQSGDYFTRIQQQTETMNQARADLTVALNRRAELARQLRGERESAVPMARSSSPGSAMSDTDARLAEARARLDELTLRFTERHPDVVATQETIRQLEHRQAEELAALRRGEGPGTSAALAANPVYQSIQTALNVTDVEIASLRGRVSLAESNIAQLRRLATTAPEVEADYSRLTRDYEVTRAQYNSLLERLEKARLTDEADQTGGVNFDIIDPPAAPLDPVAPDRLRLVAVVFIAAMMLGGGAAYLLSRARPVFLNARSLAEATGLQVLGAVTTVWIGTLRTRRRRELFALGVTCAGLLFMFLSIAVWQIKSPEPLGQLLG